jgi:hypothetical protein
MNAPPRSPRQQYLDWVEEQIEEYKGALTRDELLSLADDAVRQLFDDNHGQYPLTEILLKDAVDALIFKHLGLPSFRKWRRSYHIDTPDCPQKETDADDDGKRMAS